MRALLCAGLAAVALCACSPASNASAPPEGKGDKVVNFADSDAKMSAAIAQARKTLPVFWKHLQAHPEMADSNSLKVALPADGGGHEHIWVSHIQAKGDQITGRLANEPNGLPGMSLGSPVTFKQDQISDWTYKKDGKLYGHYTTRIVIEHIDPAEAAQVRAVLSENPVESDAS